MDPPPPHTPYQLEALPFCLVALVLLVIPAMKAAALMLFVGLTLCPDLNVLAKNLLNRPDVAG